MVLHIEAPRSGAPNWVLCHMRSLQNVLAAVPEKTKNLEISRRTPRARARAMAF